MEYKFKLAELLKEKNEFNESIQLYKEVMEVCETIPHCQTYKHKSILSLAEINIGLANYYNASIHFERYAYDMIKNDLLKLKAKESLFNAILCKFYDESVENITKLIDRYCNEYPIFETSRENQLLTGIIHSINKNDEDGFTNTINEYDQISRLTDWQVKIFLKIKEKSFNNTGNNLADDDLC